MGPDMQRLIEQLGWPAVTLIFLAWVCIRIGRYFAPLIRELFVAHISLMQALEKDASEKTEILKSCRGMLVELVEREA